MSRRNFILLIIVLGIASLALLSYWYFKPQTTPEDNTGGNGTNFVTGFPNGSGSNGAGGSGGTGSVDVSGGEGGQVGKTGRLVKISRIPVAGFSVFQKEKTKGVFIPALHYVDRATGNIYETYADTIEEHIITKTVVPKIHDAWFANGGNNVFMRYLKSDERTVETFGGTLPKQVVGEVNTNTDLKSSFLLDNITDLSVAPDSSKIFYLLEGDDSVTGVTLDPLTNKKTVVFTSPFTEWLSFWPNPKMITLTTKPSGVAPGYMYSINPDKKDLTKVLGGINGLTTLTSPSGKMVLYGDGNLSLYLFNAETKTATPLGVRGLPEKCVWNLDSTAIYCASPSNIPPSLYPDSWYQGEVSFDDQIFKIDINSGNASLLLSPREEVSGLSIDAVSLGLDKSETYLFFVNKKDSGFWKFNLK